MLGRRGARRGLLLTRAVWALGAAGTASWGLLYYTFGVLLAPTAAALGVSEAQVSAAFSVALVAAAAAAPGVGRAVDRVGAGPVMAAGSLLGAVGFALVSGVGSTAGLYAAWALLGIAHAATSYEPAFAAVSRWFPEEEARRRALVILTTLGGLASPIFVPLAAAVVSGAGLRDAAAGFAAVLALLVAPIYAALPSSAGPPRAGGARSAPVPWELAGGLAIHAFASTALATFAFPAVVARGIAPVEAGVWVGLAGAAQIPARLLYGALCRVVPSGRRLPGLLAVQAVALAGVGALPGAALAVALLVFGAANGLVTLERAAVVAGPGAGARGGTLAASALLARAAAPVAMGLFAQNLPFSMAFGLVACALAAAGLMVHSRLDCSTALAIL